MKKHFVRMAAALMALLLAVVPIHVSAATSAEIKEEIDELEEEAYAISLRREELQEEMDEVAWQEADTIYRKSLIDQDITILQEEIANTQAQIGQYELLVSEKEAELEAARDAEALLYSQYESRIRSMEENGNVTYWSILFQANSFSDLLDRMDMIQEITRADQAMMVELNAASQLIIDAEEELLESQAAVEEQKAVLALQQAELEVQSAEAQLLIDELAAQGEVLAAAEKAEEEALYDMYEEIAAKQDEYEEQLAKEWAEEAAQREQQQQQQGGSTGDTGTGTGGYTPPAGSASFIYPCAFVYISSPYGYRDHPESGQYHFHGGVDFAANQGTPVYATAAGTVTVSAYNQWNGNYITIAHSGGYSSMYLHLLSSVVSSGTYVSQGQLIGYVGSTGTSTGPHLDFRILYYGATVNPMDYLG